MCLGCVLKVLLRGWYPPRNTSDPSGAKPFWHHFNFADIYTGSIKYIICSRIYSIDSIHPPPFGIKARLGWQGLLLLSYQRLCQIQNAGIGARSFKHSATQALLKLQRLSIVSLRFVPLYAMVTWVPFKIPLWLIQQWRPFVFFCHLRCRAVQHDKSQTHYSLLRS